MKKMSFILGTIAVFSFLLLGCKKESTTTVDPRDAYVGSYNETVNGSLTVTVNGQSQSSPVNSTGVFSIEKGSSENRIVRVDSDNSRYEATISGNHVQFDPMHQNTTQNGMTMTMTSDVNGNLTGNVLNYTMIITGTAYYQGYSYPLSGNITAVAIKK